MLDEKTAWQRAAGVFEESGLRTQLVPTYADALLALRDTEIASRLREAGFTEAAALIQPDPDLVDAAWGEEPGEELPADDATDGPPPRIRIYVGMASIAGSTETYELAPEEVPPGWHRMSDDQKEAVMQPIVKGHMDNVIQAGWGEGE
ncbi:hypothetical protein [Streptomyces kronopolitis]|uniref:hypothetical protein n=1 Tax=Streptomyces kronopolitis TaxID=1612435 RepID=UPI003D98A0F5